MSARCADRIAEKAPQARYQHPPLSLGLYMGTALTQHFYNLVLLIHIGATYTGDVHEWAMHPSDLTKTPDTFSA